MPVKVQNFSTKQSILLAAAIILMLPALLTNLGLIAFYDDEGIRSLVALEMQISGNYITPTMFGEYYYNKPPLYNWILIAFFELTGRNDEFIARLPTVLFLLAYAGSVYWFFKGYVDPKNSSPQPPPKGETPACKNETTEYKPPENELVDSCQQHYGKERLFLPLWRGLGGGVLPTTDYKTVALLTSLALITCGRILFWDSMLGLIDICFSWVMFLLFMVIYREGEKGRYGRLFLFSYLLAAIGFMLKGLPALVFLGMALLAYFIWQKKIAKLFSWQHIMGGAIFLIIVGGYYFLYSQENGLEVVFNTLFDESAKRTFVEYGFGDTLLHLFSFPFEMWYHFLPWTLFIVLFFNKNAFKIIKENKFITWNILVFIVTVLPYWTSVEVYPRYLFMHVPLVFSAIFYLYLKNKEEGFVLANILEMVFFGATCLAFVAAVFLSFWEVMENIPFLYVKSAGLAVSFALLNYLYWRWKMERMLVFVLVLLVARIGFNWFVLPSRLNVECSTAARSSMQEAIKKADGHPIYIYKNSLGLQPVTGYYYSRETKNILWKKNKANKGAYYLVLDTFHDPGLFEEIMRVKIIWKCGDLMLGGIKENTKEQ